MVKTPTQLTLLEYLEYDDGTDNRYELVDGELVEVPPESELNLFIATVLGRKLEAFVTMRQVKLHSLELAVPAIAGMPLNRQPDLTVITTEHIQLLEQLGKAAITQEMPPPLFVAEVVSPYRSHNDKNYKRDYIDKRQQYQELGIPEYWIIDPTQQLLTVLLLADGTYRATEFRDNQQIVSQTFPELKVTAAQILSAS
ncbi:MAG: Uma2 family endonuclease [Symploca sp. SIO2E9]|nr:Uma2 family endonuclease [Symploca sp. SIO2E9]